MVGPNLVLTDFKGVSRKDIKALNSFCVKCRHYYDTNSIWFHIKNEQSVCFACYIRHRIPFLLLHRFLSREVFLQFLPDELTAVLREWDIQKDRLLVRINSAESVNAIPSISYLLPHLQYNVMIHAERRFVLMPAITYQFTSRKGETARIKVISRDEAFYVYYSSVGSKEFILDTKTTNYLEMLIVLDHQIESCLFCYEYSRFYKPPQPKPQPAKMVGIHYL